jgi:hypothetical protein
LELTEQICRTLFDRTHEGVRVWLVDGLTLLWWAQPPGVDRELPMKAWFRVLAGDEELGTLRSLRLAVPGAESAVRFA